MIIDESSSSLKNLNVKPDELEETMPMGGNISPILDETVVAVAVADVGLFTSHEKEGDRALTPSDQNVTVDFT